VPIIDVSMPIRLGMHLWPGDPELHIERPVRLEAGDGCNLTTMSFCVHLGTHVDAPLHFIEGGGTVDDIAPEVLLGPARVVAVASEDFIHADDVRAADVHQGERILFRTRNSKLQSRPGFAEDFVGFAAEAAQVLAEARPLLVGIDYLSVGPYDSQNAAVHHALLGAGIVLVEGLALAGVEPGGYELIVAPLRIAGAEGAPARAFLRR
jgi:arylformamidase